MGAGDLDLLGLRLQGQVCWDKAGPSSSWKARSVGRGQGGMEAGAGKAAT